MKNENLVGKEVWLVEYYCDDGAYFGDCNGVFATKERAIASVENDFYRCFDTWTKTKEIITDPLIIIEFICNVENGETVKGYINIFPMDIQ